MSEPFSREMFEALLALMHGLANEAQRIRQTHGPVARPDCRCLDFLTIHDSSLSNICQRIGTFLRDCHHRTGLDERRTEFREYRSLYYLYKESLHDLESRLCGRR